MGRLAADKTNKYLQDRSHWENFSFQIVSKDCHSLVSAHYRLDSHPRVSSLHEVVVGNRYLYLVYPKAHGDLHSYVRSRKRLRESEAKRLFKQIAETVQVCHRNGIVLRDLKLRKFVFADPQRWVLFETCRNRSGYENLTEIIIW